jgi:phosphate starvation-inducible PhoH-like protein
VTLQRKSRLDKELGLEKVRPLNKEQKDYLELIHSSIILFCKGAPGSGKSYLAICYACEQLLQEKTSKIIIVRPVVEAGSQRMGFMPGSAREKMDPYLGGVFEVLHKYFLPKQIKEMEQSKVIEVVPLAFARGRTFTECVLIAEECQNCTLSEMKMLLTRLGNNCKMLINGDTDQCDLVGQESGLEYCIKRLRNIDGINSFEMFFSVRHDLVNRILERLK